MSHQSQLLVGVLLVLVTTINADVIGFVPRLLSSSSDVGVGPGPAGSGLWTAALWFGAVGAWAQLCCLISAQKRAGTD